MGSATKAPISTYISRITSFLWATATVVAHFQLGYGVEIVIVGVEIVIVGVEIVIVGVELADPIIYSFVAP
jgi:vacuolar-type H+-ATPase subunit I/STV1